jgi:hypothetical protein
MPRIGQGNQKSTRKFKFFPLCRIPVFPFVSPTYGGIPELLVSESAKSGFIKMELD